MLKKIYFVSCIALACSFLVSTYAYAATMQSGEEYVVPKNTTREGDVYFGGKTFLQEGTTTGDVVVGASDITLAGYTKGEALLAGGTVWIKGKVDGDVRVAGGVVTVYGTIHEDLLVVAGTLVIEEGAHVEGDVYGVMERADIRGVVDGAFHTRAQSVVISGVIKKDTSLVVAQGISIIGTAHLYGPLSYRAPREAYIENGARIDGEKKFSGLSAEATPNAIALVGSFLFTSVVLLIGAGLLMWLSPSFVHTVSSQVFASGYKEVLGGFGLTFVVPFVAVVLSISILGLIPGALLLFAYFTVLVLTIGCMPLLLGVAGARIVEKSRARTEAWAVSKKIPPMFRCVVEKKEEESFAWAFFGVIAFVLLSYVPVIGTLVIALLFFLVMYTLCVLCKEVVCKK